MPNRYNVTQLYFYRLNIGKGYVEDGIAEMVCEARELTKTYKSGFTAFPNYRISISKDEIGEVKEGFAILTERNLQKARALFREHSQIKIKLLEDEMLREKYALRIINESEG